MDFTHKLVPSTHLSLNHPSLEQIAAVVRREVDTTFRSLSYTPLPSLDDVVSNLIPEVVELLRSSPVELLNWMNCQQSSREGVLPRSWYTLECDLDYSHCHSSVREGCHTIRLYMDYPCSPPKDANEKQEDSSRTGVEFTYVIEVIKKQDPDRPFELLCRDSVSPSSYYFALDKSLERVRRREFIRCGAEITIPPVESFRLGYDPTNSFTKAWFYIDRLQPVCIAEAAIIIHVRSQYLKCANVVERLTNSARERERREEEKKTN